jgi:hypothetical protein
MSKTHPYKIENGSLHLRSLDLSHTELLDTIETLKETLRNGDHKLTSFSLSYNNELGDAGVSKLVEYLSSNIISLGLVDCGINDHGATKLLEWVTATTNLQTLCIEENNFSVEIREAFQKLSRPKGFSFSG